MSLKKLVDTARWPHFAKAGEPTPVVPASSQAKPNYTTVYHATEPASADAIQKEGFKMKPNRQGRALGNGIYLTDSADNAKKFGTSVLHVALPHNLKLKHFQDFDELSEFTSSPELRKWARQYHENYGKHNGGPTNYNDFAAKHYLGEYLTSQGYDGARITYPEATQTAVFNPSKLKVLDRQDDESGYNQE